LDGNEDVREGPDDRIEAAMENQAYFKLHNDELASRIPP
jgi:hypothetical protein